MKNRNDQLGAQAIVLAAGKATRFKTKKTKLLFNICGRSMILYPLKVLESLRIPMTIVLGYQADEVQVEIENANIPQVDFVIQEEQLGTGHAVACTQSTWVEENILIMYGDTPLVPKELIHNLILQHKETNAALTFCTTMVIDPTGYGRILEKDGKIEIVEEKNCTEDQRAINRINVGIYVATKSFLESNINKLQKNPETGEIYLVDLVKMACDQGLIIDTYQVPFDDVRGVNNLQELWSVEQIKRSEFIKHWMARGVRFELAQSIHIDIDVEISPGSFIGTGVHLLGNTKIGEECFIGAFTIVENTIVGDHVTIFSHSVIQDSVIGNEVEIGPFARVREHANIGNDVCIGNFVEIKKTTIGDHTKTKHLTYLGDAEIGQSVNIGAGTIICNFNGAKKMQTIIEDNAFIGSNNTLIAPLHIGKGAYTAGGSTITEDVPSQGLAIGRAKQENKLNYAHKIIHRQQSGKKCDGCCSFKSEEEIDQKKNEDMKKFNFQGAVKTSNDQTI